MQSKRLPFDMSFIDQFQWSQPERDINIVMQIVEGHSDDEACPALTSECARILRLLASNPITPASVLDHLVRCVQNHQVLERVAGNPNLSVHSLKALATHESIEVRCAVAESTYVDDEIIALLAGDDSADVRFRLAENHDLPDKTLESLCGDENPYVAHRAQMTRSRTGIGNTQGQMQHLPIKPDRSIRRAV